MKTVNLTFNTIQDIFPGKGLSTKYTLLGRMKMIQDDEMQGKMKGIKRGNVRSNLNQQ